jgi:hypothetical protein
MRIFPVSTSNKNVPKDAYLLAETYAMSDEIITTYYADKENNLWAVTDWINDKRQPVPLFKICRLTGETENMLLKRVESYFHFKYQND